MLWSTYAEGCRGNFWWCAFDQGMPDYAPYDWNNYRSDYGFFRAGASFYLSPGESLKLNVESVSDSCEVLAVGGDGLFIPATPKSSVSREKCA